VAGLQAYRALDIRLGEIELSDDVRPAQPKTSKVPEYWARGGDEEPP
jgi:hypothetical protein